MTNNKREMTTAYKIAIRSSMIALAMVVAYLESMIPVSMLVPGMKLGLTNVVVLFALYKFNEKEAIVINLIRIVLVGLTFGNTFSMIYSLAGGLLSGAVMIIMKKTKRVSMITVSVLGGVFHNVGQILVAMFVLDTTAVGYYLLVLWFSGIIAGVVVGIVSSIIVKRIPDSILASI